MFKKTTNKLKNSRVIKIALCGIGAILLIKGASLLFTLYMIHALKDGGFEQINDQVLIQIMEVLNVKATGAIATVTTAVIARYGIRESTSNIAASNQENKGG